MKGKLYKMVEGYILSITDDGIDDPYGITNPKLAEDYGWKLLSISNCDDIFGVVDVEKLKSDYIENQLKGLDKEGYEKYFSFAEEDAKTFIEGFNKAMELNKDKVFTLEDMKLMFEFGYRKNNLIETTFESALNFIQSLQQPIEIEVEIIMSPCYYDTSLGGFSTSYTEGKPIEEPKLDKNGCLILKKI